METTNFIPAGSIPIVAPSSKKVTIGPKERLPQNIKLNKVGDVIQSIEVRCACGETIIIHCEYE